MNPEEMFKRFFGFSAYPDGAYKGYGHGQDSESSPWSSESSTWSSESNLHPDIFRDFEVEMHRQMEEFDRQMREVFLNVRIAEVPSFFPVPEGSDLRSREANPRNFMLKDDDKHHPFSQLEPSAPSKPALPVTPSPPTNPGSPTEPTPPAAPTEPTRPASPTKPTPPASPNLPFFPDTGSLFKKIFTIPKWNRTHPEDKVDLDLDGKSPNTSEIAEIFKKGEQKEIAPLKSQEPWSFSHSNSFRFSSRVGADGKVEERRIVRDSSGREEETVTRKIGDSSHSVTTIKDEGGVVEKRESFQNIDKDKMEQFQRHWGEYWTNSSGSMLDEPKPPSFDDPKGIFERLFGLSWR